MSKGESLIEYPQEKEATSMSICLDRLEFEDEFMERAFRATAVGVSRPNRLKSAEIEFFLAQQNLLSGIIFRTIGSLATDIPSFLTEFAVPTSSDLSASSSTLSTFMNLNIFQTMIQICEDCLTHALLAEDILVPHPTYQVNCFEYLTCLMHVTRRLRFHPDLTEVYSSVVYDANFHGIFDKISALITHLAQILPSGPAAGSIDIGLAMAALSLIVIPIQLCRFHAMRGAIIVESVIPQTLFNQDYASVFMRLIVLPILSPTAIHYALTSIYTATNITIFCEGVMINIDFISLLQLMYRNQLYKKPLMGALQNALARSESCARALVNQQAASLVAPLLYDSDYSVARAAAGSLAYLCIYPSTQQSIDQQTEDSLLQSCRMVAPVILQKSTPLRISYDLEDVHSYNRLLHPDAPLTARLCGLIRMAEVINTTSGKDALKLASPSVLQSIRICAASSDAFIYSLAVLILHTLNEAIPSYRDVAEESVSTFFSTCLDSWSIDQVCLWVGTQSFKNYRHSFRENLVSGDVLLKLTDLHLTEMGIQNSIHRLAVLSAIQKLETSRSTKSSDQIGSSSMTGSSTTNLVEEGSLGQAFPCKKDEEIDVFISYRRQGGSVLAHLLRREFQIDSLTVFLDVENLGTGDFRSSLLRNLNKSNNVVLLLTVGALDRCKGDEESKDFVHMEISTSLAKGKNIVPVFEQGFVFPSEQERLEYPEDMRGVFDINAVQYNHIYLEATMARLKGFLKMR